MVDISVEGGEGDVERLRRAGEQALDAVGRSASELSIVLCDDAFIQPLNAQWRNKDLPTDVLSFPQDGGPGPGPDLLGDVVISSETAARQAREAGHTLQVELEVLLVHGLCHLLGLDHEEPADAALMRDEEDRILRLLEVPARSGLVTRSRNG